MPEAEAVKPWRANGDGLATPVSRTFRKRAMYENLMDEAVTEENQRRSMEAVKRNKGAAGIDRMTTKELESHLQAHGEQIRAKLLAGTYVPSP